MADLESEIYILHAMSVAWGTRGLEGGTDSCARCDRDFLKYGGSSFRLHHFFALDGNEHVHTLAAE